MLIVSLLSKKEVFFIIICLGIDKSWTPANTSQDELIPEPDPALDDGQELPQYYGVFPKEFYNCNLEDVDIYYKQRGLKVKYC